MRKIWVVLLATFAAATFLPTLAPAANSGPGASDAASLLAISKDDRILGSPTAPITIVEYASLTCPHCAHFTDEVLPEIKKKWIDTGKVKLVLRDFPLDDEAVHASMIARCAPHDRFYAFIDTFFADQANWAAAPDYQAALSRLAELGGMSKDQSRRLPQRRDATKPGPRQPPRRREPARCQRDPDILCQRHQVQRRPDGRGVRQAAIGSVGKIVIVCGKANADRPASPRRVQIIR